MNRVLAHSFLLFFAAAISACSTMPSGLDLSLTQSSMDRKYVVELQPPSPTPAINQMHSWQVRLASPNGQPITRAHIEVDGGMPQHGHGLPTHPQVTREVADGVYLLEGMGIETGVKLEALFDVSRWLAEQMGADLPGLTYKAGGFAPIAS